MSVLKKNITANFVGGLWTGLMGLVFVPLYIHFLGIEAYGLIGIFAALLALFGLLDMGLSTTLNREIARLIVRNGNAREMRDLVRTLEIPYWAVGLLITIIVIVLSPSSLYKFIQVRGKVGSRGWRGGLRLPSPPPKKNRSFMDTSFWKLSERTGDFSAVRV